MALQMPDPDGEVLKGRVAIATAMRKILPAASVIDHADELRAYETDALTAYRQPPLLVVLPDTTEQVCAILRWCHEHGVKVVPRGSGTSLSGGSLPLADSIVLSLAKLNRILEVRLDDRIARVQPGVTNLAITQAVEAQGFFYAPDPSSQIACSIGGNVAENSGGVHCLKYGLTTHNVLGVTMALITGEVVTLGGASLDGAGFDLLGVVVGSEGLLGVVTEVIVRLTPTPESVRAALLGFSTVEGAAQCVADIMAAGVVPAGLEMMDRTTIHAAEAFVHAGYPLDVEALLIVELDGPAAECEPLLDEVCAIARKNGVASLRTAADEAERARFWAGRKAAFPAVGRISPDYYCMDGTIPRARLPEVLNRMQEMSGRYGLRVANVFHAGDGNLHPLILFDANKPGEAEKTIEFGDRILALCIESGGTITGEHGVGVEKLSSMCIQFSSAELERFHAIKHAFDAVGLLNPGKAVPTLARCGEFGRKHVHDGQVPHPDIPRY